MHEIDSIAGYVIVILCKCSVTKEYDISYMVRVCDPHVFLSPTFFKSSTLSLVSLTEK